MRQRLDAPCDVDMAPGDSIAEVHASVGEAFDVVLRPLSHPELADIRIDENLFPIGRAEAPFDSCAPEAVAQLSRRHARIFTEHGAVYLADLDSKNGTSVNGVEVRQKPAQLHHGDTISFGSKLSYRVQFVPRAKPRATVARGITVTLTPEHDDLGLQPIDIAQFPFLISKADELIARYREEYPHQVNYVSRRHAHIFLKNGAPFIEDLGSTNGTFVNGERLDAPAVPLDDGDRGRVRRHAFRLSRQRAQEPEGDSTLTQVKPTAAKAKCRRRRRQRQDDLRRLRAFVPGYLLRRSADRARGRGQPGSAPRCGGSKKDGERRRERSKFAMMSRRTARGLHGQRARRRRRRGLDHRRGRDRGARGDFDGAVLQWIVGASGEGADRERPVRAGGERRERLPAAASERSALLRARYRSAPQGESARVARGAAQQPSSTRRTRSSRR